MKLGLVEMIEDVVKRVSKARDTRERDAAAEGLAGAAKPALDDEIGIGRIMSAIEDGNFSDSELAMLRKQWQSNPQRSEEHTSELQSLMRISYAVFCLKKKHTTQDNT